MTAVVDTNLLLLLVAAPHLRDRVSQHKRLGNFTYEDFEMLRELLGEIGDPICAPPHVLAEVSNLIVQGVKEPDRSALRVSLGKLIAQIETTAIDSRSATGRPEYIPLGLTDAVLLCLAETGGTLVTTDFDLWHAALKRSYQVINFNHFIDTP